MPLSKRFLCRDRHKRLERGNIWTDVIAVGSKEFVERSKQDLGLKAQHKIIKITGANQNSNQVEEDKVLFFASKS